MALDHERLFEQGADFVGDSGRVAARALGLVADLGQQDYEFVAAEATDRIFFPQACGQALRNLDQQVVADRVPQCVVDRLEPIEIDEQHRAVTAMPFRLGHFLAQRR